MANFCDFNMKITGRKSDVEELIAMFRREGKFKEDGLGKLYDCDVMEFDKTSLPGIYEATCWGDCAWSIKSAMREDGIRARSLENECERLGLVVEAYSSEPGGRFQEHLLIVKGEVVVDDCVHYEEHDVSSYVSLEVYNEKHDTSFTKDMVNDDGDICIGGFGDDYCNFEDATEYFKEEKEMEKTPLEQAIGQASNVAKEPYRALLPERCYGTLALTGEIIILSRGETGYYKTDFSGGSREDNIALANELNEKLGVNKAQAAAMLAGSMHGWNVPLANPNVYDEQGALVADKIREVVASRHNDATDR